MRAARIAAAWVAALFFARLIWLVATRNIAEDSFAEMVLGPFVAALLVAGLLSGQMVRAGLAVVAGSAIAFVIGYVASSQPIPNYPRLETHHIVGIAAVVTSIFTGMCGLALVGVGLFQRVVRKGRAANPA